MRVSCTKQLSETASFCLAIFVWMYIVVFYTEGKSVPLAQGNQAGLLLITMSKPLLSSKSFTVTVEEEVWVTCDILEDETCAKLAAAALSLKSRRRFNH